MPRPHGIGLSAVDCWGEEFRRDFCCIPAEAGKRTVFDLCFNAAYTRDFCCHPADPEAYQSELRQRIVSWWSRALGGTVGHLGSWKSKSATEVLDMVRNRINEEDKYIVNVGGACYSPLLEDCLGLDPVLKYMVADGWRGVVIDPQLHPTLQAWLDGAGGFAYHSGYLTPENAPGLLRQWNVPGNFALLKIDIDSDDCDLLEAILEHYSPAVIMFEVNPEFIPPIDWHVTVPGPTRVPLYPNLPYGCSAQRAHRAVSGRYKLLQYDMLHSSHDITWIRNDLAQDGGAEPLLLDAFVAGWMEHQRVVTHTEMPRPFREWYGGDVDMWQLVRARRSHGELARLLSRLRGTIRHQMFKEGSLQHVNFTLGVLA